MQDSSALEQRVWLPGCPITPVPVPRREAGPHGDSRSLTSPAGGIAIYMSPASMGQRGCEGGQGGSAVSEQRGRQGAGVMSGQRGCLWGVGAVSGQREAGGTEGNSTVSGQRGGSAMSGWGGGDGAVSGQKDAGGTQGSSAVSGQGGKWCSGRPGGPRVAVQC
ncbi:unnamed protein product [Eretmochelys imbricata]